MFLNFVVSKAFVFEVCTYTCSCDVSYNEDFTGGGGGLPNPQSRTNDVAKKFP